MESSEIISCGAKTLYDSFWIHYQSLCQLLLNQGQYRDIHYNTAFFHIHSH